MNKLMEKDMENKEIEYVGFGDKVRSFDFEFIDDCFYEGKVVDFGIIAGCERYTIKVTKKVWKGEEVETKEDFIYPPVNGTQNLFGGVTNGIKKIEEGE